MRVLILRDKSSLVSCWSQNYKGRRSGWWHVNHFCLDILAACFHTLFMTPPHDIRSVWVSIKTVFISGSVANNKNITDLLFTSWPLQNLYMQSMKTNITLFRYRLEEGREFLKSVFNQGTKSINIYVHINIFFSFVVFIASHHRTHKSLYQM